MGGGEARTTLPPLFLRDLFDENKQPSFRPAAVAITNLRPELRTTYCALRASTRVQRQVPHLAQDVGPLHAVQPSDERNDLGDEVIGHEIANFVFVGAHAALEQI